MDILAKPSAQPAQTQAQPQGTTGGRDILAKPAQQPGIVQSLAQGITSPFLKLYETVKRPVEATYQLAGGDTAGAAQTLNAGPTDYGYFGKVGALKPIWNAQNKFDPHALGQAVGTGAEIGSYLPMTEGGVGAYKAGRALFGGVAKDASMGVGMDVVKGFAKQAVKDVVKEGAIGGGLQSGGAYMGEAENPSVLGLAGHTALGAAAGGAIAGVIGGGALAAGAARQAFAPAHIVERVADNIYKVLRPTSRQLSIEAKYGKDSSRFLANFMLANKLNFVKDAAGKLDPSSVIAALSDEEARISEEFSKYLQVHRTNISLDDFKEQTLKALDTEWNKAKGSDFYKMKGAVVKEIEALKATYGRPGFMRAGGDVVVPIADFNRIKQGLWGKAKGFLSAEDRIFNDVNFQMGHTAKDMIETAVPDLKVKSINEHLGNIATAQRLLEARRGFTLPGGRLGRYFARMIGAAMGAKFGPIGSAIGMVAADRFEQALQNPSIGPAILRKMAADMMQTAPDAIRELESKHGAKLSELIAHRNTLFGVAADVQPFSRAPLNLRGAPTMPESYSAVAEKFKAAVHSGEQPPIGELLHEAQKPTGKAFVKTQVDQIPKSEGGSIAVYRVGGVEAGPQPVSLSRQAAEAVSKERIARGEDGTIMEMRIYPDQVEAVLPGLENELVVRGSNVPMETAEARTFKPQPELGGGKNLDIISAFNASKDQQEIGRYGNRKFELGSFGREQVQRKIAGPQRTVAGEPPFTRLESSKLPETIQHVTTAFKGSVNRGYRDQVVIWVSEMPNGEKRAFMTLPNQRGAEEIINGPYAVGEKFIENAKKNGLPEEWRTGITSETGSTDIAGVVKNKSAAGLVGSTYGLTGENDEERRKRAALGFALGFGGIKVAEKIAPEAEKLVTGFKNVRLPFFDRFIERGKPLVSKTELLQNLTGYQGPKLEKQIIEEVLSKEGEKIDLQKVINTIEDEKLVNPEPVTLASPTDSSGRSQLAIVREMSAGGIKVEGSAEHTRTTLSNKEPGFARYFDAYLETIYKAPFPTREGTHYSEISKGKYLGHTRGEWGKDMDIPLVVSNLDGTPTGETITIPGKKTVFFDEFQTDVDQTMSTSIGTMLEEAKKLVGEKTTEPFDTHYASIVADERGMARSHLYDIITEKLNTNFGYDTKREFTNAAVRIRGSNTRLANVIKSPGDYTDEQFEKVLSNAWRAAREHQALINKRSGNTSVMVKTPQQAFKGVEFGPTIYEAREQLSEVRQKLTSIPFSKYVGEPKFKNYFSISEFRNLLRSFKSSADEVEALYNSPSVKQLYQDAYELVNSVGERRKSQLERLDILSGRITEFKIRSQARIQRQAGKEWALLPTGETNRTIEGHSTGELPFYKPVVEEAQVEKPILESVSGETPTGGERLILRVTPEGKQAYVNANASGVNRNTDIGHQYFKLDSPATLKAIELIKASHPDFADAVPRHMNNKFASIDELVPYFSSERFLGQTGDEKLNDTRALVNVLSSIFYPADNMETVGGIFKELPPDSFVTISKERKAAGNLITEENTGLLKDTLMKARGLVNAFTKVNEADGSLTKMLSDQETQKTIRSLHMLLTGHEVSGTATESELSRAVNDISRAVSGHAARKTAAYHMKYSKQIPEYFEKLAKEKSKFVKLAGHTMRLVKLPPLDTKPISQFAAFPLLFVPSIYDRMREMKDQKVSSGFTEEAKNTTMGFQGGQEPLDEETKKDLAATIYSEAGGNTYQEIEDQARKILQSIFLRAKETGQGPRDVLSTSGAYAGYQSPMYQEYLNGPKSLPNARKARIIEKVIEEFSTNPQIQDQQNNSFFHQGEGQNRELVMRRLSPLKKNPVPTSTPYF